MADLPALMRFADYAGEPWHPTHLVAPLAYDFVSDGPKLRAVLDLVFVTAEGGKITLDTWQACLLDAILERYPDDWPDERLRGRLRFRQVLVSLARQNGKTTIGSALALWALLMHTPGPEVISLASTVEQARILYTRVKHVIDNSPLLSSRYFSTGTRGIRSKVASAPGSYSVKVGKEEKVQGISVSLGMGDEIHLWPMGTWDALVLGTSARPDGMVAGITTAGDANSEALKALYKVGHAAVQQADDCDPRFFLALWEAEAHLPAGSPEALIQANPAIACGRLSLDQEVNACKTMPEGQVLRYRHNVFVASSASWLPSSKWSSLDKAEVPAKAPFVLAVDRSPSWGGATITASAKVDGKIITEVVASLVNPTIDTLEDACQDLWRTYKPGRIFMRAAVLKDLSDRLRERNVPTEFITTAQFQNVCALAYAAISEGRVAHAHDWVVGSQLPKAVSKNVGDGWILSTKDSTGDIDAVISTVIGIYGADVTKAKSPAVFVRKA